MIADFAVCADDIMSEERGLGTAPSAPTADNWPGPETRNDGTGAAEGAGDAILPVYKTDRSGNGTTLRHTGYACAPSDVAARHVASIFVRMDYREMTRLYPVGSLLLVDQRARPYNGCTVVALVDNATIVVRRYTAGNNTVVLSSWSYDAPSPDLILDKRRVRIIGVVVFFQASHDTEAL
ncbi:S24 family peptidase [Adlercreutzia sp.]